VSEYASEEDDLVTNPVPRCACVLLLDTSGSMEGEPISHLNNGVRQFFDELNKNELAQHSVEIAIITFGGPPKIVLNFTTAANVKIPAFTATGATPMGPAVDLALQTLSKRLVQYEAKGVSRYRPLVVLMADGQPTDLDGQETTEWRNAAKKLRTGASKPHRDPTGLQVCCVAIGDMADVDVLSEFCSPNLPPIRIKPGEFGKLFRWFSVYIGRVVNSVPGSESPLDDF
jgi:uncharacterized protein YegL